MEILDGLWNYGIVFLIVLSVVVFVHEYGHFWVARACGVKVETFSIGFGRELFGWNDGHGTRWKFSLIPLGGYVKMFGDSDATSARADKGDGEETEMAPDGSLVRPMTDEEKAVSFHHKSLGARSAIVAAGPVFNFLFAIIVLAGMFMTLGQPFTPPVVGEVMADSAAEAAGLQTGDRIVRIDSWRIERFEEIQQVIRLHPGEPVVMTVLRDEAEMTLDVTPSVMEVEDNLGNTLEIGLLGIGGGALETVRHNPAMAVWQAVRESWNLIKGTLTAVGQMIVGSRDAGQISGPLGIAQMSGEFAQIGLVSLIWFVALLSVNLGLINLFPVPMLDGGHLLFYAVEAVRGKPVGERTQEVAFRFGLAVVLTLAVFATWNDLVRLNVVDWVTGLWS